MQSEETVKSEEIVKPWGVQLFELHAREPLVRLLNGLASTTGIFICLRTDTTMLIQASNDSINEWPRLANLAGIEKVEDRRFSILGLGTVTVEGFVKNEDLGAASPGPLTYLLPARKYIEPANCLLDAAAEACEALLRFAVESHLVTRSILHEVHLALSAVKGASEYVSDKLSLSSWYSNPRVQELVRINAQSIHDQLRLATMLNSNLVRHYSLDRDSERGRPVRQPVDIATEIENAATVWERIAHSKQVEIRCDLQERGLVLGDLFQLQRLLDNIISNAVKYSYASSERSGGKRFISISTQRHDPGFRQSRIAIRVSNYGVGILDHELSRVTEAGYRGELAEREQPTMGLGIGLYLVKEIVEAHGGELRLTSKYLHETSRVVDGKEWKTETHKVDCVVILPLVDAASASKRGSR